MKHKLFKIKNTPIQFQQKAFRTPNRTNTQQNLNSQFSQMIGLLTTFIKKSSDIKTNNHHNQEFQLQPRDRLPLIDPLKYVSSNDASEKQLKLWMTNVCKTVFSATFNFYLTDQLNYEQARSFCSESILHNLIRLAQKVNLNSDNIKMLDNHMQYKILPYMAKKYPLTGQSQINKALEDFIQEVNSFQQLQNDFIYISGVKFHYRQSGNYNDLIMKVINYHLIQIDKQSEYIFEDGKLSQNGQSLSNYKDFEEFMINLFQKVQNQNWMINQAIEDANNSKKPITSSVQNQKYREKIRSFTNYRIGRKISQNVELFQEHEILNGHLIIKNHSILRILTKWCEQLQQKFKNPNYMKEHYENIQTLGGDINSINDFHRQIIDDKMSTQFGLISEYLQKLKQNFYEQQHSQIMNNLQDSSCDYIEHYDHVFGTFSIQIVRNLHMYIIKYLNRLIHGMISVAYDWHRESGYKHNYEKWSYPPTLVTFRIGDLIRCKCSSKEKQILAIFKQLTRISSHFPDKLKIIRIKNRLRSQTNDILINVKYNKHLIGQIQLAVNTKKQKFAQLSNNLNHYCYQLSRCIFGPFSQLASIWKIHDPRSKQFQSFLRTKGRKTIDLDRILKKQSQSECQTHNFERYELPFRCSYCNKYHTHNDLILSNVKCKSCGLYKCIRCRMRSMNQQELKQIGFGSRYQQLKAITQTRQIQMCTYGIYVTIDSKRPQLTFFKQFKINGIIYYLAKVNGNIFKIVQSDKKSIQQFFYHNIVFKLLSQHQKYINLTANEVKQKYILPKYIHKIYKSQKEVLFLNQKNIDNTKWAKILNKQKFKQQIQKITKIQMRNNNLPNIDFLAQIYPHLQSLNLGHNINCNITKISSFKQLKYINLQQNNLTQIPKQIYTLSNLQQLDIYKNNVNQLGTDIYKLTNLKTLNLKYNNIIKFSPQFSKLTNLKQILLKGTVNLKLIPDQITLLSSLEILNVAKCNLSQINHNIRKLTNLRILQLSVNLLKQLPQCIGELVKLQKLKFQENNIQILPKFISNLTGLTQLFASKNKIRQIDIDYSKLTNLIIVYLDFNQLQTLDQNLFQIDQLRELYLQGNKFNKNLNYSKLQNLTEFSLDVLQLFHQEGNAMVKKTLVPIEICSLTNLLQLKLKVTSGYINFPPQIKQLNQLEQLNLDGNNLKTLPFQITYLSSLEKISFTHNMIQEFPVEFLKYLNKLQEIKGSFNKLRKIQKQLIDKIKKIDFSNNEIQQVEILPMNRNNVLKRLILNDNKIKQIPRNLNKLKKLKDLDLRNNQIKFLDENLMKIKSIQHLSFRIVGNPIQKIDCGNFIEDQLCQQSKNFINSLIFNLLQPKDNYS